MYPEITSPADGERLEGDINGVLVELIGSASFGLGVSPKPGFREPRHCGALAIWHGENYGSDIGRNLAFLLSTSGRGILWERFSISREESAS